MPSGRPADERVRFFLKFLACVLALAAAVPAAAEDYGQAKVNPHFFLKDLSVRSDHDFRSAGHTLSLPLTTLGPGANRALIERGRAGSFSAANASRQSGAVRASQKARPSLFFRTATNGKDR